MTTLTTKQQALLGRVRVASDAYKDARAGAKVKLRELVEQQVTDHRARMDLEVRVAFEAGVPKRQIREDGLNTTAPKTLEDSLARTAETAERLHEESDPLRARYALEDSKIRVTLGETELAAVSDWWDIPAAVLTEAAELHSAVYEIVNGLAFGIGTQGQFGPFLGRMIQHPVALWVGLEGNRAEVAEWFREKCQEAAA